MTTANRPTDRWYNQCRHEYGLSKGQRCRVQFPANGSWHLGIVDGVLPGGCPWVKLDEPCMGFRRVVGHRAILEVDE